MYIVNCLHNIAGILSDLFPGLQALDANRDVLAAGIREIIHQMGLQELEGKAMIFIFIGTETSTLKKNLSPQNLLEKISLVEISARKKTPPQNLSG